VLALPRGGVPVAFEVAQSLGAPLDIFLVRKLGVPGREELAIGAIASGGIRVLNQTVVEALNIPDHIINVVSMREQSELERREQAYRGSRPPVEIRGKMVILIDDGLATGASVQAAVTGLRQLDPAQIIVAVPTASLEACRKIEEMVERTVCLATPEPFRGVGEWYSDFSQTSDEEVRELLQQAARPQPGR
jgi:predicted phosphoribosyltransferase